MKRMMTVSILIVILACNATGAMSCASDTVLPEPEAPSAATDESSSAAMLKITSNLDVDKIAAGMVYNRDFIIDDNYMATFVATIMLSEFRIEDEGIHFAIQNDLSVYTPYFVWVCYPQITRTSPARLIFLQEEANVFSVLAVASHDTETCLAKFGGTYGTEQNGW